MGGENSPAARKKAIIAIARTLLKIAYAVLSPGQPYTEPGADFYTRRESPDQQRRYLESRIQKLYPGSSVAVIITPTDSPAAPSSPQVTPGQPPGRKPA
jgi:hypothetical protein